MRTVLPYWSLFKKSHYSLQLQLIVFVLPIIVFLIIDFHRPFLCSFLMNVGAAGVATNIKRPQNKEQKTKNNQITHYLYTIAFFHIKRIFVVNKVNLILAFALFKTCFDLTGMIDFSDKGSTSTKPNGAIICLSFVLRAYTVFYVISNIPIVISHILTTQK